MLIYSLDKRVLTISLFCVFNHTPVLSLYLRWIEGSPPKRNAAGSNPVRDAIEMMSKSFVYEEFRLFKCFVYII